MSKFMEIEGYDGPIFVEVNESRANADLVSQMGSKELKLALDNLNAIKGEETGLPAGVPVQMSDADGRRSVYPVHRPEGDLIIPSLKRGEITEPKLPSLPKFMDSVATNSRAIMEQMKAISPDSIELTIGITAGGEAGSTILGFAKASGEGSIEIKLTWNKKQSSSKPAS